MRGSIRKRKEVNPRLSGTQLMKCGSSHRAHRCDGSCAASLQEMLGSETISYLSIGTGCGGLLEPVSSPWCSSHHDFRSH